MMTFTEWMDIIDTIEELEDVLNDEVKREWLKLFLNVWYGGIK